jgi:hypothetical protein
VSADPGAFVRRVVRNGERLGRAGAVAPRLSFQAGGSFAGLVAFKALLLTLIVLLRVLVAEAPFVPLLGSAGRGADDPGPGASGAAGILGLPRSWIPNLMVQLTMMCDGRSVTVTLDGAGLVARVGGALLGEVAGSCARCRSTGPGDHTTTSGPRPGRVIRDLAVMLTGACGSVGSRRGPGADPVR